MNAEKKERRKTLLKQKFGEEQEEEREKAHKWTENRKVSKVEQARKEAEDKKEKAFEANDILAEKHEKIAN